MEDRQVNHHTQWAFAKTGLFIALLALLAGAAFAAGLAFSRTAFAAEELPLPPLMNQSSAAAAPKPAGAPPPGARVIYPKRTDLDFEGQQIEGEVKSPGEFYFQHRPQEKFDSLVKRRKDFHREMLRDVVLSK